MAYAAPDEEEVMVLTYLMGRLQMYQNSDPSQSKQDVRKAYVRHKENNSIRGLSRVVDHPHTVYSG